MTGLALGVALWLSFHVLFYGGFFFAAARFLLPVFAVSAASVAAGLGLLLASEGARRQLLAAGSALALVGTTAGLASQLESLTPKRLELPTKNIVEDWLALSDEERAAGTVPFDPVYAQAQGWLGPEALRSVHSWGKLPPTVHVRRLGLQQED